MGDETEELNLNMKRVRCPKCDNYITFDETQYADGQSLVFQCSECGKQFGSIVVIENVFHYKQIIPLQLGDNVIGRYQKGNPINTPIETVDPSVDLTHCIINVSYDKHGQLRYTLRDTNSNTGTFVDNVELSPRERRIIEDGTLFTIGATSVLLQANTTDV